MVICFVEQLTCTQITYRTHGFLIACQVMVISDISATLDQIVLKPKVQCPMSRTKVLIKVYDYLNSEP